MHVRVGTTTLIICSSLYTQASFFSLIFIFLFIFIFSLSLFLFLASSLPSLPPFPPSLSLFHCFTASFLAYL